MNARQRRTARRAGNLTGFAGRRVRAETHAWLAAHRDDLRLPPFHDFPPERRFFTVRPGDLVEPSREEIERLRQMITPPRDAPKRL